jgi:hypothetical protein
VRACTASHCQLNLPTRPFGGGSIWSLPPYQLENLLAFAGYTTYVARQNYDRCYALCSAEIKVGYAGQPAGWTEFATTFGVGSPPEAQFLWEMSSEIAQVALHRISVAGQTSYLSEGTANPVLPLTLDVHVTSDQLLAALLPALAGHSAALDQRALGNFTASNADVDLFAARADDGNAYLAFVSADDPRPVSAYPYAKPGFFAEPSLSNELP